MRRVVGWGVARDGRKGRGAENAPARSVWVNCVSFRVAPTRRLSRMIRKNVARFPSIAFQKAAALLATSPGLRGKGAGERTGHLMCKGYCQ